MSFKDSLSQFKFLSELYVQDAPNAVLMTEYPSSNNFETQFQNRNKFIIHDPYPPPPIGLLKTLGPHHLMYGWGQHIPVTSDIKPPQILVEHWKRHLGDAGCPHWQSFDEKACHITSFPFETLSEEQQVINPEAFYHLHSKQALEEIPCSQAEVFDDIQFPCVMKLSHGYAGLGNFFINDQNDFETARNYINKQWPDAPIVINQRLTDIIGDYGVQFYLGRDGSITWIGFTKQIFDENNRWAGGSFCVDLQDKLYDDFIKLAQPVAHYLHEHGYFGVAGIDILQNTKNEFFLVDLNPRLTGATPFLIVSRLLINQGYKAGLYAASIDLSGTLEDIIDRIEKSQKTKMVILSAYQDPKSEKTKCHISINAQTVAECKQALSELH